MNKKRIITIAIIVVMAILAGIVLFNINSYINNKRKDAAVKEYLDIGLKTAKAYYDANGNYVSLCNTLDIKNLANKIIDSGSLLNHVCAAGSVCFCAPLKNPSTDVYCADSTKQKKQTSGTCADACSITGECV